MRTVADLMTTEVVSVRERTPFKSIVTTLAEHGLSAVPVVDAAGVAVGLVSEADLLARLEFPLGARRPSLLAHLVWSDEVAKAEGAVAEQLMTPWPSTIEPGASLAEAARLMLHAQIKRLLVIDDAGRPVGVISRSDLLRVFLRPDQELQREIADQVGGRLGADRAGVTVSVRDGVASLTGRVRRREQARALQELASAVDGVVQVRTYLTCTEDDGAPVGSGPTASA